MNELNLNPFLQSNDSPLTRIKSIGGYRFSGEYERGAVDNFNLRALSVGNAQLGTAIIGTANVGTLTFNEISGGTAALGGTENGDGVLSVKDSGGTERVRADSTGLVVRGGSIRLENSSGEDSLDSSGVVSGNNFTFSSGALVGSGTQEITGTSSFTDIQNSTLTFSTNRNRIINISYTFNFWIYSGSTYGVTGYHASALPAWNINGTSVFTSAIEAGYFDPGGSNSRAFGAYAPTSYHDSSSFSLGSGTHNLKLQAKIQPSPYSGTPVLRVFSWRLNYVILGT